MGFSQPSPCDLFKAFKQILEYSVNLPTLKDFIEFWAGVVGLLLGVYKVLWFLFTAIKPLLELFTRERLMKIFKTTLEALVLNQIDTSFYVASNRVYRESVLYQLARELGANEDYKKVLEERAKEWKKLLNTISENSKNIAGLSSLKLMQSVPHTDSKLLSPGFPIN